MDKIDFYDQNHQMYKLHYPRSKKSGGTKM